MSRKSEFQFTNPALLELSYAINKEYSADEEKQIQIEVKTKTNVGMADSGNEAFVILHVEIGGKDMPFWVEAEEGASFRWDAEILSESDVDALLKQNAPALLLSYLRSTVAMVTAASPLGTYNIPFMNFTCSEDDK